MRTLVNWVVTILIVMLVLVFTAIILLLRHDIEVSGEDDTEVLQRALCRASKIELTFAFIVAVAAIAVLCLFSDVIFSML